MSRRFSAAALGAAAMFVSACQGDLSTDPLSKRNRQPIVVIDTTTVTPTLPSSGSALAGFAFYIDPYSKAQKTADSWRATRPLDAAQMDKIATQPMAKWFGSWNSTTSIRTDVAAAVATVTAAGRVPVFVAYNIPQRDCGGLSGSNPLTPDAYRTWISEFARGLGTSKAVIILEPDALAAMGCLSSADQTVRVDLIKYAISQLNANGQTKVYLDGGHPKWISATTMATRLLNAGVASAAGFSLNVSNFIGDADNVSYGAAISNLIGGKHFIIDSGRNGLGPTSDLQWCNPEGRAIGKRPTTSTGNALVDAYLWIKLPGESDGACNGYPSAGAWMPEYALGLAVRG
jgi:endoglucanase